MVFDSLPVWNIGEFDAQADFSYNTNNLQVQFSDLSLNAGWWYWDVGDGTTSTLQHPLHVYAGAGVYPLTLISGNQYGTDTAIASLTVTPAGFALPQPGSCLGFSATEVISHECQERV